MSRHRWLHRGVDEWAGIFFLDEEFDEATLRATVIAEMRPGDRVFRTPEGHLLRFALPRRMRSEFAPGHVLWRDPELRHLWSFQPSSAELLGARTRSAAQLQLKLGGERRQHPLDALAPVAVGEWIDLGALEVMEFPAFVPRRAHRPKLAPPPRPSEELLDAGRPEFNDERERALDALRTLLAKDVAENGGGQGGPGPGLPGWGSTSGETTPSWLDRARSAFSKLVWRSNALAEALGRRQARYMRKLADMFEHGKFDDALRHAIPLNAIRGEDTRVSLGLPSPRSELHISRIEEAASSRTLVPPEFLARLEAYYRDAARALEAEGRLDEAAFVWFELLRDAASGIAMLERHDRHALAAELAESREMAPALVVRLWFQAKQVTRAVSVARRTGAFADAVFQLERRDHALAGDLRRVWARHAAARGDFVTAVEAAWPVDELRPQALEWLERAMRYSGPEDRASLWARKLELSEAGELDELLDELRAPGRDATQFRLALAAASRGRKFRGTAHEGTVARALVRPLLLDLHGDYGTLAKTELESLLQRHADDRIRSDLPTLVTAPSRRLMDRTSPIHHEIPLTAAGDEVASSIVTLPDGGCLIAAGERGVVRLDPRARPIMRSPVGADLLVAPGRGALALAAKVRGSFVQLSRVDLARGSTRWWTDLEPHQIANELSEGILFFADDQALQAIDLGSDDPEIMWRVPFEPTQRALFVHVSRKRLHVLVYNDGQSAAPLGPAGLSWFEVWDFDLPSLTLRKRHQLELFGLVPEGLLALGMADDILLATLESEDGATRFVAFELSARASGREVFDATRRPTVGTAWDLDGQRTPLFANAHWLAWSEPGLEGRRVILASRKAQTTKAEISCRGVDWIRAAGNDEALWVSDSLGRVWTLRFADGAVLGPWTLDRLLI